MCAGCGELCFATYISCTWCHKLEVEISIAHKTTMLANNVLAYYEFSDIIFIMLINIKMPHL